MDCKTENKKKTGRYRRKKRQRERKEESERACIRQHFDEGRISADSHHYSSRECGPRALKSNPLHLILDFSLL